MTINISKRLYATLLRLFSKRGSRFGNNINHNFILCYHDISNRNWDFSTTSQIFKEQIDYLTKHFQVVSLEEILNSRSQSPAKVAITFDDGFATVFSHAYPILSSYNVTAAVFILDQLSMRLPHSRKAKLLSHSEIKKLKKSGWTIGYHTRNHQDLTQLKSKKLERELCDYKNQLERKLDFKLSYLAYPYGRSDKRVVNVVKSIGYKGAFLVDGKYLIDSSNLFSLGRITISSQHTLFLFEKLLTPIGLFINQIFTLMWRFKDNLHTSYK